MRESPTHRQPKKCFCIIQNQCTLPFVVLVAQADNAIHWINLFPVDSTELFVNIYMYLLYNNSSVGQHYPSFEQLGYRVCTMNALIFMYDRILNYMEFLDHND